MGASQQVATAIARTRGYRPTGFYDEMFDEAGGVRDHYVAVAEQLLGENLAELAKSAQNYIDSQGVTFTTASGTRPFRVDPVPRVIPSAEWKILSAGISQRAEALNQFVGDVYGDRRIVSAGVIEASVIEGAEYYEPDLVGHTPPAGVYTHVAGLDIVRGGDGVLRVLEDNLRSPSGISFALAARRMSWSVLGLAEAPPMTEIGDSLTLLADALLGAAPAGVSNPVIALVSDGPGSAAWYEHKAVANALDIYIYSLDQLETKAGAVFGRGDDDLLKPVDVIYRRTDLDRLRSRSGALTRYGSLLLEPLRRGTVACVNAFGSGVADDKLVHSYVEDMIRFYLDQEPLIESVTTYDPSDPVKAQMIEARIGELVIKPRGGLGGRGVMIGQLSSATQRAEALAELYKNPREWVAQETIALSTHPTVIGDSLEPRHIDLRPYAVHTGHDVRVLPACLTRVALSPGGMIVNSSHDGGAKDTWITAE